MRDPESLRLTITASGALLRRTLAPLLAAFALSACSVLGGGEGGNNLDIVASPDDVNWRYTELSMLQAQLDEAKAENEALTRRLATLERAAAEARAAAADAEARLAAEQTRPAAAPPTRAPGAVVAAADADTALAQAPARPVESAPRLVQPSFASERETVFENEAAGGDIRLTSVLYGVHLASYRRSEEARAGWRRLQRDNPDELGLLEPRVESVTIEDRGDFLRLIAGGFSSKDKASALCETLRSKGVYCSVTGFVGSKLSGIETAETG